MRRTWIDWYIVLENGDTVLVWEPERDQSTICPLIDSSVFQTPDSQNPTKIKLSGEGAIIVDRGNANGDDADIKDNDDDADICPTYGRPSLGNAYGRIFESDLYSALPALSTSACGEISFYSNEPPGSLIFSTVIATFTVETVSFVASPHMSCFRLRDGEGRVCGFILNELGLRSPASETEAGEVLLVSEAYLGYSYTGFITDVGMDEEYRRQETPQISRESRRKQMWRGWDVSTFFNIILPQKVQEHTENGKNKLTHYERKGIGMLAKSALRFSLGPDPHWQTIVLR